MGASWGDVLMLLEETRTSVSRKAEQEHISNKDEVTVKCQQGREKCKGSGGGKPKNHSPRLKKECTVGGGNLGKASNAVPVAV